MELIPGKNVGIICAQSITSALTQSILNQFHSCGANNKTITKGLPRLLELLNLTQKLNTCSITFEPAHIEEMRPAIFGRDIIKSVQVDLSNNRFIVTCDFVKCVAAKVTIEVFKIFNRFE